MSENGPLSAALPMQVAAYDLTGYHCTECGTALGNRWLMTGDSGCATCDEAVTRHRCLSRPRLESLAVGESWRCRECWSVWTVTEEEDACGACGRSGPEKTRAYAAGARVDDAPRYKPVVFTPFRFTPFRNVLPQAAGPCRRTPGWIMIHVKPDCRCPGRLPPRLSATPRGRCTGPGSPRPARTRPAPAMP